MKKVTSKLTRELSACAVPACTSFMTPERIHAQTACFIRFISIRYCGGLRKGSNWDCRIGHVFNKLYAQIVVGQPRILQNRSQIRFMYSQSG